MSERPFDTALPPTNEPLRVAVQRMRWFRAAFQTYVNALGDHIGCDFLIDEAKLAAIFVRWLRALEVQRPKDRKDRQAFFEFAAGLMLRELTADMPLRAETPPTRTHADSAAPSGPRAMTRGSRPGSCRCSSGTSRTGRCPMSSAVFRARLSADAENWPPRR